MKSAPFRILLFFAFLLPVKTIAQPGNHCSPGNTSHIFDVYSISFCLADDFKETGKEFDSILFFSTDKKTLRVSIFSIPTSYDDVNQYFISKRDEYIKNVGAKGWSLAVDSTLDNGERFGNMPAGFKKYDLVYRLVDTNTGKFYFMVFDYIQKIKEAGKTFKHGICVFQLVRDKEDEMKEAGLNASLIFKSLDTKNF